MGDGKASPTTTILARLGWAALSGLVVATGSHAQTPPAAPPPAVRIDGDGTVHVPPITVPPSSLLTPQGKAYLAQHLKDMQNPASKVLPENGVPFFMNGYLASARAQFPVEKSESKIAGVHVVTYRPKAGTAARNRRRVMINLHGGGFAGCFSGCGELESLPVAALGQIEVIGIDYREGPHYKFPAASEDVAAVYRALLKTYPAANIGIYGCSAGGMLVGMSEAWFQTHGLPNPGALGIFCAGMTLGDVSFGGDANYVTAPIGEANLPAEPPPPLGHGLPPLGYLADVDKHDPLVAPANAPGILAKFPPTLFLTATRAFEVSSAVYSHEQLSQAGVETELHVWDGLFHGFFYNPDVPESREAYRDILKFFDRHLGR